ncbi:EboA domain-containing protein [Streptomyces sp. NPDC059788]|uniref:EboA domain-containing protein n=1 Tax=Streptomyces sp. NPDC059788 TaxID=3346948 RepID=UPI003647EDD1
MSGTYETAAMAGRAETGPGETGPADTGPAPGDLRAALAACLDPAGAAWLAAAEARLVAGPEALDGLFPRAARHCGHGPLPGAEGWTVADAARTVLLLALPYGGGELLARLTACYQHGDAGERRAVLRALPLLDVGDGGVPLVEDALRTHDARLVAAAVGPYAAHRLPQHEWRHAVLKCLSAGVPLTAVAGLARRHDAELARMLRALADECDAAGRPVPAGVRRLAGPRPAGPHPTTASATFNSAPCDRS